MMTNDDDHAKGLHADAPHPGCVPCRMVTPELRREDHLRAMTRDLAGQGLIPGFLAAVAATPLQTEGNLPGDLFAACTRAAEAAPVEPLPLVFPPGSEPARRIEARGEFAPPVCPSCHVEHEPGNLVHADGRCWPACLETIRAEVLRAPRCVVCNGPLSYRSRGQDRHTNCRGGRS